RLVTVAGFCEAGAGPGVAQPIASAPGLGRVFPSPRWVLCRNRPGSGVGHPLTRATAGRGGPTSPPRRGGGGGGRAPPQGRGGGSGARGGGGGTHQPPPPPPRGGGEAAERREGVGGG